MIYDVKNWKQVMLYALQQVLAVITATLLIANICGTPVSSCLFGACIGTLTYQLITKFKSPIFLSSCGATAGAVIASLQLGGYSAVVVGGFTIFIIYCLFALIVKVKGIETFNKMFPAVIVGAITMVIGINLAGFIPGYINGSLETFIAISTMIIIAICSCYCKGFAKTIPFLIGIIIMYFVCLVLTIHNVAPLIDISLFENMKWFALPDFTFRYMEEINLKTIIQSIIIFLPVAIAACLEHYSDHKVLSNIIDKDLTTEPGLHRTLIGDGLASLFGTLLCGLPNTSYGESIATVGFSKVASVKVISVAALILGLLSFIGPVQALIQSIPSCVFGGAAMILYGYIIASGLKTIINNKIDLDNNKNLIIVSVILTVGSSGLFFLNSTFAGVSLALVLGIVLNLILK